MAQTPKKPSQPVAPQGPQTRRARSRHQRELQRQRLVMIIAGVAIGLALLAVLCWRRAGLPGRRAPLGSLVAGALAVAMLLRWLEM